MEGSEAIKLLRLGSLEKREITAPEAESKGTIPIPLETLVVDQDAARDLLCGICLQILTKPQQCKNGHLFCQSCIQQHVKKHPECPQCRTSLKESDLSRCLFVERHIRQLKVWCKYHFRREEEADSSRGDTWVEDPEGCTEIAQLEEIAKHEAKCGFAFLTCKYSNKCERLRRKDLSAHEKSCIYRPLECTHCKQPVESNKMEEHLLECKMIPVKCDKCNTVVQRGDLDLHKKDVCLEENIPCQFVDQGCEVMVLRKNLKEHLAEQSGEHLLMLKKAFDDQALGLKVNFDNQLKLREDRIKHLERALSEIDTKIEWRVKNWSTVKKKSYIQSEKFHFAEFSWFVGFYTDGDNEESRGYISVYLFLDVASMPKGKNVTIEFLLKFINHKDANDTVRKEFKTTFPIKGGQGWGDRKAIKSARISEENGFLKQDCLYVEAQIILKKVQWILH